MAADLLGVRSGPFGGNEMDRLCSVVVVMPAYNEEGIVGFLAEIEAALREVVGRLAFVVVDDHSSRDLPLAPGVSRLPGGSCLRVLRNDVNRGHGPTALRAYAEGLVHAPDVVIHVDGDGQFLGEDVPRLLAALAGQDAVVGIRTGREDPWFRSVLTRIARMRVGPGPGEGDANSPLRAYRTSVLTAILASVPENSVVPHLHFARAHARLGLRVAGVPVTCRSRRGASAVGTTWQNGLLPTCVPSRRLLRLAWTAWLELAGPRRTARTPLPSLQPSRDAA